MLAKVNSGAVVGLEAVPVEVEVDIASQGFPAFKIVGLPDKAIEEAKERVRAALKNSRSELPNRRITVNLSPADLPKKGPAYDFPIALGILVAYGQVSGAELRDSIVIGELSLDGSLRGVDGVLPLVLMAKEEGFKKVFLPKENASEAAVVSGIEIIPVASLRNIIYHFQNESRIQPHENIDMEKFFENLDDDYELDFKDVVGQNNAKLALQLAAAGGHNLAMTGPAGSGKTLLARTLPSILPRLTVQEALEVTKIYSITGNLKDGRSLIRKRPFRSPHHTVSRIGLIGGGSHPAPGEISLAHRGVLFLDEFPEFPRHVLEALRQPIEDGIVSISRARMSVTFPANFMIVTAQNPCPCGNYNVKGRECNCTQSEILRYQKKVSGPMLDRIDLHVHVPNVEIEKLTSEKPQEGVKSSRTIREEVQKARGIQEERFKGTELFCNADMSSKDIKKYCPVGKEVKKELHSAMKQYNLSARSYHKMIKVSRTLADYRGEERITTDHVRQVLRYKPQELKI